MASSLYLQLTTRCNMRCAHCGFACTETGKDMDFALFRSIILTLPPETAITLGGGEPTVHPDFDRLLDLALARIVGTDRIRIITNGKLTRRALRIAKLAHRGRICAVLSRTRYHEQISHKVVQAFGWHVGREVDVVRSGRAWWGKDNCLCPVPIIRPDGQVQACACQGSPLIASFNPSFPHSLVNGWRLLSRFNHKACWGRRETITV